MVKTHNTLHEGELIEQAIALVDTSDFPPKNVEDACEVFYHHGFHDGSSGDVETFGHFYRVHRWIVWTDNYGFHDVETYDNEEDAIKAFEKYDAEYTATFDTDECF